MAQILAAGTHPLTLVCLLLVLGLAWIARGAGVLGLTASPLAMFVFGACDLLVAAGFLLAVPPTKYLAWGLLPLQVVAALWLGGSLALALIGAASPAALAAAIFVRPATQKLAAHGVAGLALLLLLAAGGEPLAQSEAGRGQGDRITLRRSDTAFGVSLDAPPGFLLLEEVDDLESMLTVPAPEPHREVFPLRSSDGAVGGFVLAERLAVSEGVPAQNFAMRVIENMADLDPARPPARSSSVSIPRTWRRHDVAVLEYRATHRGLEQFGAVMSMRLPDGRVITVAVTGPSAAAERVRNSAGVVAGALSVTNVEAP